MCYCFRIVAGDDDDDRETATSRGVPEAYDVRPLHRNPCPATPLGWRDRSWARSDSRPNNREMQVAVEAPKNPVTRDDNLQISGQNWTPLNYCHAAPQTSPF